MTNDRRFALRLPADLEAELVRTAAEQTLVRGRRVTPSDLLREAATAYCEAIKEQSS